MYCFCVRLVIFQHPQKDRQMLGCKVCFGSRCQIHSIPWFVAGSLALLMLLLSWILRHLAECELASTLTNRARNCTATLELVRLLHSSEPTNFEAQRTRPNLTPIGSPHRPTIFEAAQTQRDFHKTDPIQLANEPSPQTKQASDSAHCCRCTLFVVVLLYAPRSSLLASPARHSALVLRQTAFPTPISFIHRESLAPLALQNVCAFHSQTL